MKIVEKLVVLNNEENLSKDEVIKLLATKLLEAGYLNDYEEYLNSVYKREEIAATTVGYGIGLPHGKGACVKESVVAFMRVKNPVLWNLQENEKVKVIFMLAVSEKDGQVLHNDTLVELSKKILNEKFREKIETSNNIEEIVQLINR